MFGTFECNVEDLQNSLMEMCEYYLEDLRIKNMKASQLFAHFYIFIKNAHISNDYFFCNQNVNGRNTLFYKMSSFCKHQCLTCTQSTSNIKHYSERSAKHLPWFNSQYPGANSCLKIIKGKDNRFVALTNVTGVNIL